MDHHLGRPLPTTADGWTKSKTAAASAAAAASAISASAGNLARRAVMHAAADAVNYYRTTDTFAFAGVAGDTWEQPLDYFPGVSLQEDERHEFPWRAPTKTTGSNSGSHKYRPNLYSNGFREKTGWAWIWSDGKQRLAIVLGKGDYNDSRSEQRKRNTAEEEGEDLDSFIGQSSSSSSSSSLSSSTRSGVERSSLESSGGGANAPGATGQTTLENAGGIKGGANTMGCGSWEVAPMCSAAADCVSKPHPATTVEASTTIAATSTILTYTSTASTTAHSRRNCTLAQQIHVLAKLEQHQQHPRPSHLGPQQQQQQPQRRQPRQDETKKQKEKEKQDPNTNPDTSIFSYCTAMQGYEDMRFAYEMQPHRYPRLGAYWEPPKGSVVELAGRAVEDVCHTDRGEKGATVVLWFRKRS